MPTEQLLPTLTFSLEPDGEKRTILIATAQTDPDVPVIAATLAELVAAAPDLASTPAGLARYCDALNYLARALEYRVIHDPTAFIGRYTRRWDAEDPDAPFVEGVPSLHDFGKSDLTVISAPAVAGDTVVFYAEDDFLGIPYRVTGPAPHAPNGETSYEPVDIVEE